MNYTNSYLVTYEPSDWYVVIVDIKSCCAEIQDPMSSKMAKYLIKGEANTILS